MKNKNVGFLIIGLSLVIAVIILIFNIGMKSIVSQSCSHGSECAMYSTISVQTGISLAIAGLVLVIGLFLIFSKEENKIIIKKIKEKGLKKSVDYSKLNKEEKIVVRALEEMQGSMFQSDLADKTQFSKVKITRILDRLEGMQVIERKRRGMTNFVVLKH